jgi:hypothetical protein
MPTILSFLYDKFFRPILLEVIAQAYAHMTERLSCAVNAHKMYTMVKDIVSR